MLVVKSNIFGTILNTKNINNHRFNNYTFSIILFEFGHIFWFFKIIIRFSIKPSGDVPSERPRPSFGSRPEIGSHCFVSHTTYIFLRNFRIRLIQWSGQFTWKVSLRWNQCCCGTAAMCQANIYTLKTKIPICMRCGRERIARAISASVSPQTVRASAQPIALFRYLDSGLPASSSGLSGLLHFNFLLIAMSN
jgi:hypothetical protein